MPDGMLDKSEWIRKESLEMTLRSQMDMRDTHKVLDRAKKIEQFILGKETD